MGLFKGMRDLQKQAKEVSKGWDPGAQMANAQQQMQAASAMMAQQTEAAKIATTGIDATATITAVRQGGQMINYQPVIEIDLTVMPQGLPPYPATVSQAVPQTHLGRAQAGQTVAVKVDPENPATIWINWAAPAPS